MNNQQQAVARFEQICDNCQVPTQLVEDHAAGDLVCSVRGCPLPTLWQLIGRAWC